MKQFTTPTLAVSMTGLEDLLAQATEVLATVRRENVEFHIKPSLDGAVAYIPLTEDQTGALGAMGRGFVEVELTIVGVGVGKTKTIHVPVEPSVKSGCLGYEGLSLDGEGDPYDAELVGEMLAYWKEYTLPAATADVLGGVMVGEGLSVTETGMLSTDVTAGDLASVSAKADAASSEAAAAQKDATQALSDAAAASAAAADAKDSISTIAQGIVDAAIGSALEDEY